MKYYIIAGEASGDLHGSNLIKALKRDDTSAEIRCWGGDLMRDAGGELVKHYRDLAFMGFAEVVSNLSTIMKNIAFCKVDIESFQPDAIILIDYPGFNMRIAKWAKERHYRTFYYISPQIWAWKENRIKAIKRDVDRMFVILPFEKGFYEDKHKFPVDFVGHPLIDAIQQRTKPNRETVLSEFKLDNRPIVALLPGSRKQEISKMLEIMLDAATHFPQYQFVIAGAPGQEASFYEQFTKKSNVAFVLNRTYDLLSIADAALVTSGTATLETALYKVPEVVCYKGGWISYQIAKRIITLKFISLVNLIMDREVVTELIQADLNPKKLSSELAKLFDPANRQRILSDYDALEIKLGGAGASAETAKLIIQYINS
ncbi:lipid-A-disaccharide synthase [Flavobacterium silvaticum]|uniref:Lipid-A-disaccharide synthase n=1 Tax=Flavobacterium silvaticum TaxID=1852020 RepID=A0A972FK06_9FLAO|nr:lipid-A-disaccharide synthase [Flavobacterium silvaticum]NMH27183.1 lipid-A-disaccharide synthase [Flavobacterium silvaticum]